MGLLADIFSTADTAKRRLSGLLADPMGTLALGVTRFGEDQGGLLNMAQNAYPMAGNKTVLNSPQQIANFRAKLADEATNQAMAGMFIGKNAKTWDAIKAKKAEEMAAAGVDPRRIWEETGTWKGPDGALRQEIPDNMAKRAGGKESLYLSADGGKSVGDVLQHKKLFDAYPMKDMSVEQYPGLGASFSPGYTKEASAKLKSLGVDVPNSLHESMRFGVNTNSSDVLHELQHAIQGREGWALGGSPQGTSKAAQDAYRNLAGEAEARATQARQKLTAAERLAKFPEDSYDVPMSQLILRGLLSK